MEEENPAFVKIYLGEDGINCKMSGSIIELSVLWSVFTANFCTAAHISPEKLAASLPEAVRCVTAYAKPKEAGQP